MADAGGGGACLGADGAKGGGGAFLGAEGGSLDAACTILDDQLEPSHLNQYKASGMEWGGVTAACTIIVS